MKTQPFPRPDLLEKSANGSVTRRAQRLEKMPAARLILGIDPGLHRTGYGLIQLPESSKRNGTIQMIEAGFLKAKANDPLPVRLETLFNGLCEVVLETQPDVVVVEELFSTYAHPRSALLMAHARGVLLLAAQQSKVPVHSFLPNEVKQVIAGNGHATKAAVQAAVKARLKLAAIPEPPDVADALAIALCFAARQETVARLGR
jgi:crossover junction endodeoxyribonuclease RuvC